MKYRHIGLGWAAMTFPVIGLVLAASAPSFAQAQPNTPGAQAEACPADNGGITLPRGFCATVFADNIGHARHLVVAPNGVVYVNSWSGRYYGNDRPPAGGFLLALQDTKGEGRADIITRFGDSAADGSHGGTGIALYNGALYAEVNDRIVRYTLPAGALAPTAPPEVIVSGLPLTGDHPMHPFAIDRQGNMYVDLGSATNSCQVQNRTLDSPGITPCTELETRAGTWRYDANRTGQHFSPAERFATGIRNGEGFAFDASGGIYVTQHGRDQLSENWPKLYRPEQGPNLPAEELLRLEQGADYGWPECYFDGSQEKLVLAPEYGGDGGKAVGPCARKRGPIAFFPAHWAPNALALYDGHQFPNAYQGGAFIAFHGSWNRAPYPQEGYNVVFQPLADGKPSGKFVVFADGFAGAVKEPGRAAHRPSGLAVGPDGALYISDDAHGRIWRVTFSGGPR
jgi:glucose/arabinose dehydrogenase